MLWVFPIFQGRHIRYRSPSLEILDYPNEGATLGKEYEGTKVSIRQKDAIQCIVVHLSAHLNIYHQKSPKCGFCLRKVPP